MPDPEHSPNSSLVAAKAVTFSYLDGLRGLAALYVVIHHAFLEMDTFGAGAGLPHKIAYIMHPFTFGNAGVDVFIVLSGYCLSLPLSRKGVRLNSLTEFLKRRACRILPAYYAALVLFLGVIASIPAMRHISGVRWDAALPAFGVGIIGSHLLLVQDLRTDWLYRIDPPMWSIAVEFQIYFLFALLLVPIWRRFGVVAVLLGAFGLGLLPHLFLRPESNYDWACPWFLGLFALGLFASTYVSTPEQPFLRPRALCCAILGGLGAIATFGMGRQWWIDHLTFSDSLVGIATAGFLVYATACTQTSSKERQPIALRLLNSRPAQFLGQISYSLYLVHFPLFSLLHAGLRRMLGNSPPEAALCLLWLLLLGIPISLATGSLFYYVFERPYLRSRLRNCTLA